MKLLVLIHRLPCPPDRGAILRAAMEVRWLAARHDVWCAGLLEPGAGSKEQRERSLAELRWICRAVAAVPLHPKVAGLRALGSLAAGSTATEGYFASQRLERMVMQWARDIRFDAVLAFSSSMAPLALRVPAPRHVLDMVDLDSHKWLESAESATWPMRSVYRTESQRLAQRERDWMAAMDTTVLVNDREADLVTEQHLRTRVRVIETGAPIDLGGYDLGPQSTVSTARHEQTLPDAPVVGFLGAMDYPPNVEAVTWFADAIWPEIRCRRPDAQWWIVGRSPTREVRNLAAGDLNVKVTGTVPEVAPYLERMRVSIAPLRLARGVQNKVLAAMAAGRPAVVTSCVATGVGAQPDRELVVADQPEAFAAEVLDLFSNRPRAEAIGQAAREFVSRRYSPNAGLQELENVLCGVN